MKYIYIPFVIFVLLVLPEIIGCDKNNTHGAYMLSQKDLKQTNEEMLIKYGNEHSKRIRKGVEQVSKFWRAQDGDKDAFRTFCLENFVTAPEELDESLRRLEISFETLNGVLLELRRQMQWNIQVDTGPNLPIDRLMANFSLASHVEEDLYKSKIAFFVLLNFPVYSLDEVLKEGPKWPRQKWAEVRLAQRFTSRVPSDVTQEIYEAYVATDDYINNYNIYMHNLLTEDGQRLFPEGLRLITHWGLRDELKSQYMDAAEGLARQKMIYEVMKHIIFQDIPQVVINNPEIDWKVYSNAVIGEGANNRPEPNTRYERWLNVFRAEKKSDPYYPVYPTKIERRFNQDREIPEKTVENLFIKLLSSKEFKRTGKAIQGRLGRELEPFDIWYTGFKTDLKYSEAELDMIVSKRFPTVEAFDQSIPYILVALGFDRETAEFLGSKIEIDPSRGAGHAQGAERRSDNAHLRTRIPASGMNYKGFNIAIHELGHNVEQVFTLNRVDYTLLQGVPNTAFTEAFAFVFQSRDLQVLGLTGKRHENAEHLNNLHNLWATGEIAAVALVDMYAWNWLYAHPEADAAEFKAAVTGIAQDVWNRYYEPILGQKDAPILAIYSHMIDAGLYLPDYPIGHIIQFQMEEYMKNKDLAREMERMCIQGRLTPNLWMKGAVGADISVEPMLKAAAEALKVTF